MGQVAQNGPVTLLSGPSPDASSGHPAAWTWFQLREQRGSCPDLAAAQASAVFLASCLLLSTWGAGRVTKETAEPPTRRGSTTAATPTTATCSGGQTTAQLLLDPRGQSGVLTHSSARGTAQPQGRDVTLDTPGASNLLGHRKWLGCSGHRFSSDPQPGSRNALENLPTRLLFYTETLTQRRHQAEILPQNGVGWQVTSASTRFQEAPPHPRVLETERTSYRQALLPSRCHGHCLDSRGLQPTFPAPANAHGPTADAEQWKCEWLAGRCFEDLVGQRG